MTKTGRIMTASVIAIAAMSASYVSVSSFMSDRAEARAEATLQAQAVAYQSGVSIDRQAAVNVNLTARDFLPVSNLSSDSRDYAQTDALSPVNFAHHKAATFISSEQVCLAQAIYYEARSEKRSGQMAVAEVVQNRVKSKHYPSTICGVIYQGSGRKSGCQFSFACDGSMDKMPKGKHWDSALELATFMQTHDVASLTNGATHYHTTAIKPVWSTDLRFNRQIGSHKFYRFNFTERPVVTAPSHAIAPPI